MNTESELRELKQRIANRQAAAVRAQVEREQAQRALDAARAALYDEYAVREPEEARAKLSELQGDLEAALRATREALER